MNIEEIRNYCLTFENTTEDIKWGHVLTFCVSQKNFVLIGLDHDPPNLSFKCTQEDFNNLIEIDGFKPAPYLARSFWVQINDISLVTDTQMKFFLQKSHHLISIKKSKKKPHVI